MALCRNLLTVTSNGSISELERFREGFIIDGREITFEPLLPIPGDLPVNNDDTPPVVLSYLIREYRASNINQFCRSNWGIDKPDVNIIISTLNNTEVMCQVEFDTENYPPVPFFQYLSMELFPKLDFSLFYEIAELGIRGVANTRRTGIVIDFVNVRND